MESQLLPVRQPRVLRLGDCSIDAWRNTSLGATTTRHILGVVAFCLVPTNAVSIMRSKHTGSDNEYAGFNGNVIVRFEFVLEHMHSNLLFQRPAHAAILA